MPTEITLIPSLPMLGSDPPLLTGWERDGAKLLGYEDAERLRDQVRSRWEALASGDARGPIRSTILLDVRLEHWVRNLRGSAGLRAELLRPREKEKRQKIELVANDDGLFDVSDLVR